MTRLIDALLFAIMLLPMALVWGYAGWMLYGWLVLGVSP